jgi:hypothetical protein
VRSVTVQAKALHKARHEAFPGAKRPGVMRAIKGNIGAAAAKKWNSVEKIAIKQKDGARTLFISIECGRKPVLSVAGARIKRRC